LPGTATINKGGPDRIRAAFAFEPNPERRKQRSKKKDATGIATVASSRHRLIWGRGKTGLPNNAAARETFRAGQIFSDTVK